MGILPASATMANGHRSENEADGYLSFCSWRSGVRTARTVSVRLHRSPRRSAARRTSHALVTVAGRAPILVSNRIECQPGGYPTNPVAPGTWFFKKAFVAIGSQYRFIKVLRFSISNGTSLKKLFALVQLNGNAA